MRRIGTLFVFVLAGGLLGMLAPAASGGGWDSLEPQHDHYLPGPPCSAEPSPSTG
jgi:hypothetical protein